MSESICKECGNPFKYIRRGKNKPWYCPGCRALKIKESFRKAGEQCRHGWIKEQTIMRTTKEAISPQKIIRMSPEQIIREWSRILAGAKNIKDFT